MSIFDEIGGAAAVSDAVDDFYDRVLTDPALAPYFTGTDLRRLKGHQRLFLAAAIGGPVSYSGRSMAEAHAHLSITPDDFDRVVEHLVDTLANLGVSSETIGAIGEKLAPLKSEIVTGPVRQAG